MTPPMTPREKAVDRGVAGAVMDALWPILGGNQMDAETWAEIDQAVGTALASGSGDHAELARLADLLDLYAEARDDEFTVNDVQLIDQGSSLIRALLAENAALRAGQDDLKISNAESAGKLDAAISNLRIAREDDLRHLQQATEAERKLAEAVGLLQDCLPWVRKITDLYGRVSSWLSKEAERG